VRCRPQKIGIRLTRSDSTLRIFSLCSGETKHILTGHGSRIWDCATSASSSLVASASGDGTVRIWSAQTGLCENVLQEDSGDVYSVRWRPHREVCCFLRVQLVKLISRIKSSPPAMIGSFAHGTSKRAHNCGRSLDTVKAPSRSLMTIQGMSWLRGELFTLGIDLRAHGRSKDKHVRLWDAVGGMCVKTMPGSLGEVTSVEFDADGKYLLAACKDNSNRLWDLRMVCSFSVIPVRSDQ